MNRRPWRWFLAGVALGVVGAGALAVLGGLPRRAVVPYTGRMDRRPRWGMWLLAALALALLLVALFVFGQDVPTI